LNSPIYLKFTPKGANQTLVNEGINSNKLDVKEFVKGEQFYLNLDIYKEDEGELVPARINTDF
jgi:hypothetical protein